MPNNVDSSLACIDKHLKEFAVYDQTVDLVSGFESYFNNLYKEELVYFDRFPRVLSPQKLTPDFTVLFDNYGIIFEIKKGIAKQNEENGDKPLEEGIKQLKRYDFNYQFKADKDNNKVAPKIQDIVLILDIQDAQEAFIRIARKIDENPEFQFKSNLIFLDYNFKSDNCCYYVRKYHGKNNNFRDQALTESKRLETIMGQQGKSIKFLPLYFMDFKAKSILCNDPPSDLYMAVYLWNRIFQNYLNSNQFLELQRSNSRKIQYIPLNIDDLTKDINTKYIKGGNVRVSWVRDGLKFLEKANLAEFSSTKEVMISYHNLQKRSILKGDQNRKEASKHEELHELGKLIAQQYCSNSNKKRKIKSQKTNYTPPKRMQASLWDF